MQKIKHCFLLHLVLAARHHQPSGAEEEQDLAAITALEKPPCLWQIKLGKLKYSCSLVPVGY